MSHYDCPKCGLDWEEHYITYNHVVSRLGEECLTLPVSLPQKHDRCGG